MLMDRIRRYSAITPVDDQECVKGLSLEGQGHPHVRLAFIWQLVYCRCRCNHDLAVDTWLRIIEGSEDQDLWLWKDGDENWMQHNVASLGSSDALDHGTHVDLYPEPLRDAVIALSERDWGAVRVALERRIASPLPPNAVYKSSLIDRILIIAWLVLTSGYVVNAETRLGLANTEKCAFSELLCDWYQYGHDLVHIPTHSIDKLIMQMSRDHDTELHSQHQALIPWLSVVSQIYDRTEITEYCRRISGHKECCFESLRLLPDRFSSVPRLSLLSNMNTRSHTASPSLASTNNLPPIWLVIIWVVFCEPNPAVERNPQSLIASTQNSSSEYYFAFFWKQSDENWLQAHLANVEPDPRYLPWVNKYPKNWRKHITRLTLSDWARLKQALEEIVEQWRPFVNTDGPHPSLPSSFPSRLHSLLKAFNDYLLLPDKLSSNESIILHNRNHVLTVITDSIVLPFPQLLRGGISNIKPQLMDLCKGLKSFSLLSPSDQRLCTRAVDGLCIFKVLSVCVFVHLKFCYDDAAAFDRLQSKINGWKTWDTVSILAKYKDVKNDLQYFLSKCRNLRHKCKVDEDLNGSIMHSADIMDILITLGTVLDEPGYCGFFSRRENEAQSLLNLLQAIMDYATLSPSLKRRFTSALIRLSRKSGRFPESIVLDESKVTRLGEAPVAAGSFGEVWKGSFDGEPLAIKVLKVYQRSSVDELLKRFSAEVMIWRQLSHPNLTPFYGVYYLNANKTRICLVSPWMQNGSIVQFLKRAPETARGYLLLDIARGLEYLQSGKPSIVHGDLKGDNILISPSLRACLTDFGLASASDSELIVSSSTTRITGTLRWQAPELLDDHAENVRSSFASDIYSLGCVAFEIYSGKVPFHEVRSDFTVMQTVTKGVRPSRPPASICEARNLNDEVWRKIQECWRAEPSSRPTAGELVSGLQELFHDSEDKRSPNKWSSSTHRLSSLGENHPLSCSYQPNLP